MRESLVQAAPLLTRINVTPIIDVALVLVIILLITAPMLSASDLELDLPAARSRDLDQTGFLSITVAADGRLAVDDRTLASPDELVPYLQARRGAAGGKLKVVVRADERLPHVVVREVLAAARAGGATRLGIATRQTEVILP